MENLKFANFQEEISLVQFKPTNYLREYEFSFFDSQFGSLNDHEKLLIIVLDRDGYFFSDTKPSPSFLLLLKRANIFVQAFKVFTHFKSSYGCFLKSFVTDNPNIKPTSYLK
jgi:hypothetical protein